ncbi:MAG: PhnD/SsuA/transferrin family substrate-binding protein [Geobacter sp.]|nr:PhnD/SsuA/transferrin family substrate-binding protein [Geobacter sp.]
MAAGREQFALRAVRWIIVAVLFCVPLSAIAAQKKSYTLAVIPNKPAVVLHRNWTPFVEELSRRVGAQIELKLYDKIATFLTESEDGIPDFIFSAPNMFYLAHQKQKYIPLVRSSRKFSGIVFVRKDSPYTSIKDLQGKTIAFVGPKNVCSVITRQALLTGVGAIDFNASFSGSTANVAKSVLLGKADAGATLDATIMTDIPKMAEEFRILLETEKVASHPLAAHPRLPKKVRDAVTRAVLSMNKSVDGRELLKAVKLDHPIKASFNRDYGIFAEVDFQRLDSQSAR